MRQSNLSYSLAINVGGSGITAVDADTGDRDFLPPFRYPPKTANQPAQRAQADLQRIAEYCDNRQSIASATPSYGLTVICRPSGPEDSPSAAEAASSNSWDASSRQE